MKKLRVLGLVALGLLVFSTSVYAAEFIKPDDSNGTVTLPSADTHHNLYTAGGNVIVNSKTTGDLYAAGGMVKVVGDVESDVDVAGGNLDVSGKVGGDVRIAGGNISISNSIGSDLLAAGGNIFIADTASIAGDFVSGGGNIELNAPVNGSARVAGGNVTINSTVKGDVWLTANKKLTFGPKAVVMGKIVYYGNSDPIIENGAQVSAIERHDLPKSNFNHQIFARSLFGAGLIISLLAWLVAGLLLSYFFRLQITNTTGIIRSQLWMSFSIGFVALVVTPIAFGILFLTIIGYYAAFLLLAFYLIGLMLSGIIAAMFLGQWLYGFIDKMHVGIDWRTILLGVVVYKIVTWIPIIGWIIGAFLCITAFGAIVLAFKQQVRRQI